MVAITAEAQVNIANGLLAYYPYNGNANDESGNAYNGTVGTGVTLSTDRFGIQNKAYNFQNDAIVSNISYDLDSNYTINVWYNTSATNHIRLFLWAETPSQPIKSSSSELNRGNSNAYIEGIYTAYDVSTCGLNQNSAFAVSSASPNPYANGQWHMLTLTRNNNLLSLYIDSVFIDDKIIVDNCTQWQGLTTQNFFVGSNFLPNLGYIGKLDDVMIHTRVLNNSEISYLYNLNSSWSSPTATELISENDINIYPNPFDNLANISFKEEGIYTIQVLDINGIVLLNTKINGKQTTLNTSNWSSGVYNLIIKHETGYLESKRIVKQ